MKFYYFSSSPPYTIPQFVSTVNAFSFSKQMHSPLLSRCLVLCNILPLWMDHKNLYMSYRVKTFHLWSFPTSKALFPSSHVEGNALQPVRELTAPVLRTLCWHSPSPSVLICIPRTRSPAVLQNIPDSRLRRGLEGNGGCIMRNR